MGPIAVFLLGAGAALAGRKLLNKDLLKQEQVRGLVRKAVEKGIELEQVVASIREDIEDTAASVREDKRRSDDLRP